MAEEFLLPCPCGHEVRVRPQQAGELITCVSCGQELAVPQLRSLRQLPTASEVATAAPTKTGWSLGRGICFSIGLGVLLIALGVAGLFGARRARLDVSPPPPIDPRRNFNIQTLDPVQAWTLWEEARDKPLFRLTPRYLHNRELSRRYLRIILAVGAVGLVGLCLMTVAMVIGSRRT